MIQGSPIAGEFKKIYASSFLYNSDKIADGVALAVNYTNKTQYLFRINKGTLDEWDDKKINKLVSYERRRIPFNRMAFFGDGETDVPCMRLITEQGGHAVAVYDPKIEKSKSAALLLKEEGRTRLVGCANYEENGSLDSIAAAILAEIAARAHSRNLSD